MTEYTLGWYNTGTLVYLPTHVSDLAYLPLKVVMGWWISVSASQTVSMSESALNNGMIGGGWKKSETPSLPARAAV